MRKSKENSKNFRQEVDQEIRVQFIGKIEMAIGNSGKVQQNHQLYDGHSKNITRRLSFGRSDTGHVGLVREVSQSTQNLCLLPT